MNDPDNATQPPGAPAVGQPTSDRRDIAAWKLALLLLDVALVLAFVTLTLLNWLAPPRAQGTHSVAPTATVSASPFIQAHPEQGAETTPAQAAKATATTGHIAIGPTPPPTPTTVAPTATPVPTAQPSPTASPTACGNGCG